MQGRANWYWDVAKSALDVGGRNGLRDAAEYLLEEANRTVPHDEGTLMRSGTVESDSKEAVISYNTPYAVRVHEHPEYTFQKGRRGKWLEKTLKERGQTAGEIIAKGLQREL